MTHACDCGLRRDGQEVGPLSLSLSFSQCSLRALPSPCGPSSRGPGLLTGQLRAPKSFSGLRHTPTPAGTELLSLHFIGQRSYRPAQILRMGRSTSPWGTVTRTLWPLFTHHMGSLPGSPHGATQSDTQETFSVKLDTAESVSVSCPPTAWTWLSPCLQFLPPMLVALVPWFLSFNSGK